MISERKIAANRANGRTSRGPKTIQGKRRSSKNALRHGLSLPVLIDPRLKDRIEALAREIAADDAENSNLLRMARAVAEAQIDLARIRRVRYELLNYADLTPPLGAENEAGAADQMAASATPDLIEQLVQLDRYERRTLSRRKTAIRRLMKTGQLPSPPALE